MAFEWEQFVLGGCPHGDTKLKKDNLLVQAIPIQKPLSIFEITGGGGGCLPPFMINIIFMELASSQPSHQNRNSR